jgi:hypothetical protein
LSQVLYSFLAIFVGFITFDYESTWDSDSILCGAHPFLSIPFWDRVKKLKQFGGLSLKKAKSRNLASLALAKLNWRFLRSPNSAYSKFQIHGHCWDWRKKRINLTLGPAW